MATIVVLSRKEMLRLIFVWEQALNRLLQTDLDTYPVEDPSWTIIERTHTSAERRAPRLKRVTHYLDDPTSTPIPFGMIWNWVRRAIHRNRREAVHRTAS